MPASGPFSAISQYSNSIYRILMVNVSCVVNAHKEGNLIYATLQTVKRTCEYALECGLTIELHVVLDSPDTCTANIVQREVSDIATIHNVEYGELAQSRNYAARKCAGEYITFIDGDDLWCQSWVVDCFLAAKKLPRKSILHPEFNLYFGTRANHVFQHVDMDSPQFDFNLLTKINFWTALSFAHKKTYTDYPYVMNDIDNGFGFEDWAWNYRTAKNGFKHKVVPGTAHYIRRGKPGVSLLEKSTRMNAIPRIMDLYENSKDESNFIQHAVFK